jgi:hypothetical protein
MGGLVAVVAFLAFGTVKLFLTKGPGAASIIIPSLTETAPDRKARLGREQSAQGWKAAQKRADLRAAAARVHSLSTDGPTASR